MSCVVSIDCGSGGGTTDAATDRAPEMASDGRGGSGGVGGGGGLSGGAGTSGGAGGGLDARPDAGDAEPDAHDATGDAASADGGGSDSAGCSNACSVPATSCAGPNLRTCVADSTGCTVWSASACPGGLTCVRQGGPICLDPNWALWPVPNGAADVDAGAPNRAAFRDNGDDTISDLVTGLMWQRTVSITGYARVAAFDRCTRLRVAGYDDWRLPSAIELASIVDYAHSNPSIDPSYFPNAAVGAYWTATTNSSASIIWIVDFTLGVLNAGSASFYASSPYYVRCVR